MPNTSSPPRVAGLAELAADYRFLLCDVWGVIHDGVRAFPDTTAALSRFRAEGGKVVLITNSPRPRSGIVPQLDDFGVPRDAYDDVVTSGEASRDFLASRRGVNALHVGPDVHLPLYAGLDVVLSDESSAGLISCTGLVDDEAESPEDYDARMRRWAGRKLPMLCVNPDRVVSRGTRLVWCAGALADRYAAMGGETIIVGKPHGPIYETALRRLAALSGGKFDRRRLLAVGDGLETDLRGANNMGIDALFVTAGIHAADFGDSAAPDGAAVHALLEREKLGVRAYIPRLVW